VLPKKIVALLVKTDTHGNTQWKPIVCTGIIVEEEDEQAVSRFKLFSPECENSFDIHRKRMTSDGVFINACEQCKACHKNFLSREKTWLDREKRKQEIKKKASISQLLSSQRQIHQTSVCLEPFSPPALMEDLIAKRLMPLDEGEVNNFQAYLAIQATPLPDCKDPSPRSERDLPEAINGVYDLSSDSSPPASPRSTCSSSNAHSTPVSLEDVVSVKFNFDMTVRKLQCLKAKTWLNDEVINFYMLLLQARSDRHVEESDRPRQLKSHFFNSFFMAKILEDGKIYNYKYANVERWTLTAKLNIFDLDKIFFPINICNNHWTLLVVFMQLKQIHYYDSMRGRGKKYCEAIWKWISDEAKTRGRGEDRKEWRLVDFFNEEEVKTFLFKTGNEAIFDAKYTEHDTYVPQQDNGHDCGMFVCMNADFVSDDIPLLGAFSQGHMEHFRLKVGTDILRGSINY